MHIIFTIKTAYSEESYFLEKLNGDEGIKTQIDDALNGIAFCDDYEVTRIEYVNDEYVDIRNRMIRVYETMTDSTVEEDFCSGRYTTLESIISGIEYKLHIKNLSIKGTEERMTGRIIADNECYDSDRYVELVTGQRPAGMVTLAQLEEMELREWNYPLTDIGEIIENGLEVVLVRFPSGRDYEYRLCETEKNTSRMNNDEGGKEEDGKGI